MVNLSPDQTVTLRNLSGYMLILIIASVRIGQVNRYGKVEVLRFIKGDKLGLKWSLGGRAYSGEMKGQLKNAISDKKNMFYHKGHPEKVFPVHAHGLGLAVLLIVLPFVMWELMMAQHVFSRRTVK